MTFHYVSISHHHLYHCWKAQHNTTTTHMICLMLHKTFGLSSVRLVDSWQLLSLCPTTKSLILQPNLQIYTSLYFGQHDGTPSIQSFVISPFSPNILSHYFVLIPFDNIESIYVKLIPCTAQITGEFRSIFHIDLHFCSANALTTCWILPSTGRLVLKVWQVTIAAKWYWQGRVIWFICVYLYHVCMKILFSSIASNFVIIPILPSLSPSFLDLLLLSLSTLNNSSPKPMPYDNERRLVCQQLFHLIFAILWADFHWVLLVVDL